MFFSYICVQICCFTFLYSDQLFPIFWFLGISDKKGFAKGKKKIHSVSRVISITFHTLLCPVLRSNLTTFISLSCLLHGDKLLRLDAISTTILVLHTSVVISVPVATFTNFRKFTFRGSLTHSSFYCLLLPNPLP